MARIRTIKPAFWTDPKVHNLSNNAALFFIGIWNFSDDLGYFDCTPSALSLLMPRFRPQSVQPMLSHLEKEGLVTCCREAGVGLVVGWKNQRIDKPMASKHEGKTYQWDTPIDSTNGRKRSTNIPRKDRIGKDRIGKDRISSEVGINPIPRTDDKSLGSKIFESYSEAFKSRYGITPVRNPKVNRNCQDIGTRLGEDAIEVARFYLLHNDAFYLRTQHPIGSLLRDAESLYTQWKRGQAVTGAQVRQFEKQSANIDLMEKVKRGEA